MSSIENLYIRIGRELSIPNLKKSRKFHYEMAILSFNTMNADKGNIHYQYYKDSSSELKKMRKGNKP